MIRQCSAELVMSSFAECGGSRVLDTMDTRARRGAVKFPKMQ